MKGCVVLVVMEQALRMVAEIVLQPNCMKEIVPGLVNNHCLALACSQAADAIPSMKKFKYNVSQMYQFYDYSAARMAEFKKIQCILGASDLKLKMKCQ